MATTKSYRCRECKRVFRYLGMLKKHQVVHAARKRAKKSSGANKSSDAQAKKKRVRSKPVNNGKKVKFVCTSCNKKYDSNKALNRHVLYSKCRITIDQERVGLKVNSNTESEKINRSQKLNAPKLHACGECGSIFKRVDHLRRHMLSHTCTKSFECNVCGSKFVHSWSLKRHIHKEHYQEKLNLCRVCGGDFCRELDIRKPRCSLGESSIGQFKSIETGIEPNNLPLICYGCRKNFKDQYSLCRHVEKHFIHRIVRERPNLNKVAFLSGKSMINNKPLQGKNAIRCKEGFRCSVCRRQFTSKKHIRCHFVMMHSSIESVCCVLCGGRYRPDGFEKHLSRHLTFQHFPFLPNWRTNQFIEPDVKTNLDVLPSTTLNSIDGNNAHLEASHFLMMGEKDSNNAAVQSQYFVELMEVKPSHLEEIGPSDINCNTSNAIGQRMCPPCDVQDAHSENLVHSQHVLLPPLNLCTPNYSKLVEETLQQSFTLQTNNLDIRVENPKKSTLMPISKPSTECSKLQESIQDLSNKSKVDVTKSHLSSKEKKPRNKTASIQALSRVKATSRKEISDVFASPMKKVKYSKNSANPKLNVNSENIPLCSTYNSQDIKLSNKSNRLQSKVATVSYSNPSQSPRCLRVVLEDISTLIQDLNLPVIVREQVPKHECDGSAVDEKPINVVQMDTSSLELNSVPNLLLESGVSVMKRENNTQGEEREILPYTEESPPFTYMKREGSFSSSPLKYPRIIVEDISRYISDLDSTVHVGAIQTLLPPLLFDVNQALVKKEVCTPIPQSIGPKNGGGKSVDVIKSMSEKRGFRSVPKKRGVKSVPKKHEVKSVPKRRRVQSVPKKTVKGTGVLPVPNDMSRKPKRKSLIPQETLPIIVLEDIALQYPSIKQEFTTSTIVPCVDIKEEMDQHPETLSNAAGTKGSFEDILKEMDQLPENLSSFAGKTDNFVSRGWSCIGVDPDKVESDCSANVISTSDMAAMPDSLVDCKVLQRTRSAKVDLFDSATVLPNLNTVEFTINIKDVGSSGQEECKDRLFDQLCSRASHSCNMDIANSHSSEDSLLDFQSTSDRKLRSSLLVQSAKKEMQQFPDIVVKSDVDHRVFERKYPIVVLEDIAALISNTKDNKFGDIVTISHGTVSDDLPHPMKVDFSVPCSNVDRSLPEPQLSINSALAQIQPKKPKVSDFKDFEGKVKSSNHSKQSFSSKVNFGKDNKSQKLCHFNTVKSNQGRSCTKGKLGNEPKNKNQKISMFCPLKVNKAKKHVNVQSKAKVHVEVESKLLGDNKSKASQLVNMKSKVNKGKAKSKPKKIVNVKSKGSKLLSMKSKASKQVNMKLIVTKVFENKNKKLGSILPSKDSKSMQRKNLKSTTYRDLKAGSCKFSKGHKKSKASQLVGMKSKVNKGKAKSKDNC